MKVQIIRRFGGPEVFEEAELPAPEVVRGHVLIRVAATSVNPVDHKTRAAGPPFAPDLPAVLHGDVAGVVQEVGEDVVDFAPGDEVYACAGGVKGTGGALAELMLADARLVARKPATLTMEEAAALPLVSITAWEGVLERARVGPGRCVLVHGATGGVGHVALQLAKRAGATVFATASTDEKLETARRLGADAAINYKEQTVEEYVRDYTGGQGFDVVFDTIGGGNLARSFEAATLEGTVVTTTTDEAHNLKPAHRKGLTLHIVFMLIPLLHGVGRERHGRILSEVARIVDEGGLRPLLDGRRFRFEEVAAAHRLLESGGAVGKVVLTP